MIEVDGYTDLERIGSGGLGDVYRATRSSTGGLVAIKVLRDVSDSSVAWHRTRRELIALVSLSGHGHVVQLLELLELPQGPALVMEYAPGGSIADLLARRDGTLTVPEVVMVGRQTAAALGAAHEQGIVHRDLKPQNLLIDAYGQVKLCDFGIASLARSEEFHTRTSALSMRYASPEDLDDDGDITVASDVYSLGATLLHLAHGAPPTLRDRLGPWTPSPTDDADRAALDAVIADCLRPTPAERPAAGDVLDRLETIDWTLADRCRTLPVDLRPVSGAGASGVAGMADAPPTGAVASVRSRLDADTSAATVARSDRVVPATPPQPVARSRRPAWIWGVGAVGLAAVVGIGAALLWPSDDGGDPTVASSPPPVTEPTTSTTVTTVTTAPMAAPAGTVMPPTEGGHGDPVRVIARPDGLAGFETDALLWPFGEAGECLVQVNGLDELMPVDCGEPHDLQRFAVAELAAGDFPPGTAFSADAVRVTTDDACRDAFAAIVGVPSGESMFSVAITRPSADTWDDGDRRYQCLLGIPGSHVVGDATGSEQ